MLEEALKYAVLFLQNVNFWVGPAGVPILLFVTNFLSRRYFGLMASTGNDFLLLLIAFDATVILDVGAFRPFVIDPKLANDLLGLHVFFLFLGIAFWLVVLMYCEPAVVNRFDVKEKRYHPRFPLFAFVGCWLPALSVFAFHWIAFRATIESVKQGV